MLFNSRYSSAEEYQSLVLSSVAALFTSLALNAAKSSIPYRRIKRQAQVWWSRDMKEGTKERRKTFAVAHRSKFTSMLLDMPRLSLPKLY